jgi:putative ABC transport system permease protein
MSALSLPAVRLARSSLRHRAAAFTASFLAVLLGATIVMAFASLIDTATDPNATSADQKTLTTLATVVGAWGLIIVVFAVASTLTVAVRQRARETALLKSIGATPAQVTRMLVGEATIVALAASLVAIPLGYAGGGALIELLHDAEQVTTTVDLHFGAAALNLGIGIPLLAAVIAALLASRRTARQDAIAALGDAALADDRPGCKRKIAGALFVLLGVTCAAVTATVFDGKGVDAMQTAGQASIWAAIGLGLLAPVLVRRVRAPALSRPLMPIILFTGIAVGCLTMQSIENGAPPSAAATISAADAQNVETLNLVVVGMIALFAAITVVNTLVATTTFRRREFAMLRLAGATPGQVLAKVGRESALLVTVGVALGTLASLATVVPYSLARTDQVIAGDAAIIWTAVAVATTVAVVGASLLTAQRAIAVPAVQAAQDATA